MSWNLARGLAFGIWVVATSSVCGHEGTSVASCFEKSKAESSFVFASEIPHTHREKRLEKGVASSGQASLPSHSESAGVQSIHTDQEHFRNDLVLHKLPNPKFVEGRKVQEVQCALECYLEATQEKQKTQQKQKGAPRWGQEEHGSRGRGWRDLPYTCTMDSNNAPYQGPIHEIRSVRKHHAEWNASPSATGVTRTSYSRGCFHHNDDTRRDREAGACERVEEAYDFAGIDAEGDGSSREQDTSSGRRQRIVTFAPEQSQKTQDTTQERQNKSLSSWIRSGKTSRSVSHRRSNTTQACINSAERKWWAFWTRGTSSTTRPR